MIVPIPTVVSKSRPNFARRTIGPDHLTVHELLEESDTTILRTRISLPEIMSSTPSPFAVTTTTPSPFVATTPAPKGPSWIAATPVPVAAASDPGADNYVVPKNGLPKHVYLQLWGGGQLLEKSQSEKTFKKLEEQPQCPMNCPNSSTSLRAIPHTNRALFLIVGLLCLFVISCFCYSVLLDTLRRCGLCQKIYDVPVEESPWSAEVGDSVRRFTTSQSRKVRGPRR